MKLARFRVRGEADDTVRLGRVDGDVLIDLSGVAGLGSSVTALLPRLAELRATIENADGARHPLPSVVLEPPIDAPQKYLAIGMNYAKHAEEARAAGIPTPANQLWFNKQVSCIVGPNDDIVKPAVSDQLDYEVELAVVIGTRCRHVTRDEAPSVVAGYLVANDVSVRDWLTSRSPTFTLGKSFDTHGPIGPWLTTADEIVDPHDLDLRLYVNGELRQSDNTGDMIYDIWAQIAELSTVMTLVPGDIIATGTPSGIGAPTGRFLVPGDVVRAEIDGLGALENTVAREETQRSSRREAGRHKQLK